MFDITKKTHKTESNERITCWFVLIKIKGSIKWLNEKKQKKVKRKQKKEEEDKLYFFWKIAPSLQSLRRAFFLY